MIELQAELLNSFQHGQQVTISINIRGREWKSPSGGSIFHKHPGLAHSKIRGRGTRHAAAHGLFEQSQPATTPLRISDNEATTFLSR